MRKKLLLEVTEINCGPFLVLAECLAPMEEDADFRGQAAIDDEWIDVHGTIIDELFLGEDGIARLIDGVDELLA